jgi:flagellar biosynthetic protein FliQ
MDAQDAVDLGRQAMLMTLLLSAPMLLVGMAVGLAIGLLQALTQVQDQTAAFVVKIVAMFAVLAFCLPWLLEQMLDYSQTVFADVPRMILGG